MSCCGTCERNKRLAKDAGLADGAFSWINIKPDARVFITRSRCYGCGATTELIMSAVDNTYYQDKIERERRRQLAWDDCFECKAKKLLTSILEVR